MEKRAGRVQKKTLTFISEVVGSGDNLNPNFIVWGRLEIGLEIDFQVKENGLEFHLNN